MLDKNSESNLHTTDETIGQRIARYRKLRGWTQKQLADRIGIARILISDYERGRIRLYDEMVARVAKALRISTDELLGVKTEENLDTPTPSLRFLRRIAVIETFPETRKKHILRSLDDAIEASKKEQ